MPLEIPVNEYQLGHGGTKWLKPEKIAALHRESKPGRNHVDTCTQPVANVD